MKLKDLEVGGVYAYDRSPRSARHFSPHPATVLEIGIARKVWVDHGRWGSFKDSDRKDGVRIRAHGREEVIPPSHLHMPWSEWEAIVTQKNAHRERREQERNERNLRIESAADRIRELTGIGCEVIMEVEGSHHTAHLRYPLHQAEALAGKLALLKANEP